MIFFLCIIFSSLGSSFQIISLFLFDFAYMFSPLFFILSKFIEQKQEGESRLDFQSHFFECFYIAFGTEFGLYICFSGLLLSLPLSMFAVQFPVILLFCCCYLCPRLGSSTRHFYITSEMGSCYVALAGLELLCRPGWL